MIDPITVAIAATTVAAIDTGVGLLQVSKQNEIKKEQKRHRYELLAIEGTLGLIVVTGLIDASVSKKEINKYRASIDDEMSNINTRLNDVENKLNNLHLEAIDAKLDILMSHAQNPNPIVVPPPSVVVETAAPTTPTQTQTPQTPTYTNKTNQNMNMDAIFNTESPTISRPVEIVDIPSAFNVDPPAEKEDEGPTITDPTGIVDGIFGGPLTGIVE